ncbi:pyrroline-5-carboxylate reductase 3 [Achroia grisella]|uniref:pyrroline-5-carboxylate reductase 3 n=1 Tax=Achroia grisella TaxID=688607 RepID=UPI0027D2AA46|nr:pyrroline-5-carboxylate reductase 3 [Achroia grisella]
MYNLGFIGGGNMSTAIARGIITNDAHPVSKIWVSGPNLTTLKHWSEWGTNVTVQNSDIFYNCDIIFLGIKPGLLSTAIKECLSDSTASLSQKNVLFVSMLAGITIDRLQQELSTLSQNVSVVRIMPNTPMSVGAGACLYTPDQTVSSQQCELLEKLLSNCGICEKVPESLINPLGALTACGPAFIYVAIEALADGAVKQGVPRQIAIRLAAQMVAGSGKMVVESGKHPGLLKDEVCSPGGSTICGVTALENGKLRATLISAIEAATVRTKEIGKN